jgi:hypothetical protein
MKTVKEIKERLRGVIEEIQESRRKKEDHNSFGRGWIEGEQNVLVWVLDEGKDGPEA